jgi:hypothetical protein
MNEKKDHKALEEVLDFWFPEGLSFQFDGKRCVAALCGEA